MSEENAELRKRRITLADGRYLIFYTFGDETESAAGETEADRHV